MGDWLGSVSSASSQLLGLYGSLPAESLLHWVAFNVALGPSPSLGLQQTLAQPLAPSALDVKPLPGQQLPLHCSLFILRFIFWLCWVFVFQLGFL